MELGQVMIDADTDNIELELSTPRGTVVFEISMKVKEYKEV